MMLLAAGNSVRRALAETAERLGGAGIEGARHEARLLVAAVLGRAPREVWSAPEAPLDPAAQARLAALVIRRCAREPISRLLGYREFWSLRFALSPATLDPRPDSETLVEAALAELQDRGDDYRLLDLGTGTGCLLLALLSQLSRAWGLGIDRSFEAAVTAQENATALGLSARAGFSVGDWGDALGGKWDAILANPPYIPSAEIERLMPEVARHEPRLALDGGPDGLAAYRAVAPQISRLLAPAGLAFLEVGRDQKAAVAAIMEGAGLALRGTRPDLSGIDRCLVLGSGQK